MTTAAALRKSSARPGRRIAGKGAPKRAVAKKAARRGTIVLGRADYEGLLSQIAELRDRLEGLEDARDLRAALENHNPDDYLPIEAVERLNAGEHPVRIWRERRGLTLSALAKASGVPVGYLSEIENGKKPGSVAALKKLALALRLDLDDLVR